MSDEAMEMSDEEPESDDSEIIFSKKLRPMIVFSSSEEEEENVEEWHDPKGDQPKLTTFTGPSGFKIEDLNLRSNVTIAACYELFVTNELFEQIVEQTNLYASQQLENRYSQRLGKWTATNKKEIQKFFGLIIWMGLVRLPSVQLYWTHDPAYIQTFPKKIMSRNRFEILLRMIHFANNKEGHDSNHLYKIQSLVNTLETNFKKYYNPTKDICIDESLVQFRGRIIFQKYLKQSRHKYGIKIFKLRCGSGYTYALRVYAGKPLETENTTPTEIVMSLCRDLFNKGYTLYTDNWYTSLELAEKLIENNTHLVGILRSNRQGNPQKVVSKKLNRGEMIAQENKKGITILKWRDKQDILLLSTKHSSKMVNVESRSGHVSKPQIVIDYNRGKAAVDISDQMNAYNNPVRKSIKWYKKLAFELLLNITVLNSHILYKSITKKNICITEFRKKLAEYLTDFGGEDVPCSSTASTSKKRHQLQKKSGKISTVRRYCKQCYEENAALFGREMSRRITKQVATFCDTCEGQPFFCLNCFNKIH